MEKRALTGTFLPELGIPFKGKVRDVYEQGDRLVMIAGDHISMFDRVFSEPIPDKGRVLNAISAFWFEKTKDIIANHLISQPDPNVMVVKKCRPIMAEIIVRGYMTGSLWRDYSGGKREKCGIKLSEGLGENDPLPLPIVTPTTKSLRGHDTDINASELVREGIVSEENWRKITAASLKLFQRGREMAEKMELVLVDTKYEFGLDEHGDLLLIDEIHTPDSSRYWFKKDLERSQIRFPDKEFARNWARSISFFGEGAAPPIPDDIVEKIRGGYREVLEAITGQAIPEEQQMPKRRLLENLREAGIIKGKFALILAGSVKDSGHVEKICAALEQRSIPHHAEFFSAHKNPDKVLEIIRQYNESIEPLVCITVAGKSNALSGVVAANLKWPTIACPSFKDYGDYFVNIHSSLQMPGQVAVLTVVDPGNAALAAFKILEAAS